jgi:3-phytase
MVTALAIVLGLPAVFAASADDVVRPVARLETKPVPNRNDAADDPAIWVHPDSPELSLILGTDKQGGLHVYNMDGTPRGMVGDGTEPNNVDVIYGFDLGGKTVDLAVASTRGKRTVGVKVWAIDSATRELSDVTAGNVISVFNGREPYGCCGYRSGRDGRSYVFVTAKDGKVEQHELRAEKGRITSRRVAGIEFDSSVEGCVADDELGFVYVGEERRGVWKFTAEPGPKNPTLIAREGEHGLDADVEGLAIYYGRDGAGYLVVSSQGNNQFKLYERGGSHRFVTTIRPRAGKLGDVEDTDGIAVTSQPTSRLFAQGLFIAQDGHNRPRQNFKLFAWEDIAGGELLIDTQWRPRR